jgi:hypothetical protein
MSVFQVFIGYDPKEAIAYHTLAHSILRRSSIPVSIAPVMQSQLKGSIPARAADRINRVQPDALSRAGSLAVPRLVDVHRLRHAVSYRYRGTGCVARAGGGQGRAGLQARLCAQDDAQIPRPCADQVSAQELVERDAVQHARCAALTPEYVNKASGLDLHRFSWLKDEQIGSIPLEWNWLVGEYDYSRAAKIVHFTLGGPYFDEYRACDYAAEWFEENRRMNFSANKVRA